MSDSTNAKTEPVPHNRRFIQEEKDRFDDIGKAACVAVVEKWHPEWVLVQDRLDQGGERDLLFKDGEKRVVFEVEVRSADSGSFDRIGEDWPTFTVPARKRRSLADHFISFRHDLAFFWHFNMQDVKNSPLINKLCRQPNGDRIKEPFFDVPLEKGLKFEVAWDPPVDSRTKDLSGIRITSIKPVRLKSRSRPADHPGCAWRKTTSEAPRPGLC